MAQELSRWSTAGIAGPSGPLHTGRSASRQLAHDADEQVWLAVLAREHMSVNGAESGQPCR